jgi:tRNA-splicing ligase RtcB
MLSSRQLWAVDIGCGMNAVRTSLRAEDLPDGLREMRRMIEKMVPVGMGREGEHTERIITSTDKGVELWSGLESKWWYAVTKSDHSKQVSLVEKMGNQLGTLGSGNHFIELCLDDDGAVWVMLHSGSRGIGNFIGTEFIARAKRAMEMYHVHLPDTDLAYLPDGSEDFKLYCDAVHWAQDYALANRADMMDKVLRAMRTVIGLSKEWHLTSEAVNCHHNYIARENHFGQNLWVTRKGAISARAGQMGIVPGSMGTASYIVRGKGNAESYCSCAHGAGRKMSRSQARRVFTKADLEAQTAGVECRKDEGILDEIPGSYKDIDTVMANSADLVSIEHRLKAILCVKGA